MLTIKRCLIKTGRTALIFLVMQALIGCKQLSNDDHKSESKNIDVAAKGTNDAVKNDSEQSASVEYCLDEKGSDSKAVVSAIIKKLPTRLAKEYENVEVSLIADVEKLHEKCLAVNGKTKAPKALGDEKYVACWGPTSKTEVTNVRPEIFLYDDINNIHNNLIVMVISSYLELYIDQILAPVADSLKADDPNRKAFEAFKANRKELATQFASVLGTSNDKDVKSGYKEKFLGDAKASDEGLISDLAFQNFVLSEVGESAFCSSSTLKTLKEEDKYKAVWKAFEPFDMFFKSVQ